MNNNWYARTSATSYVANTTVYYSTACVNACTTTYPLPSAGGPNLQTLYWSTPVSPQSETFSFAGGPFYLNSALTTGISSLGSRSYSNTYVCRFISGTNQLSPASLCPGY
jgi:hypothetical protein